MRKIWANNQWISSEGFTKEFEVGETWGEVIINLHDLKFSWGVGSGSHRDNQLDVDNIRLFGFKQVNVDEEVAFFVDQVQVRKLVR